MSVTSSPRDALSRAISRFSSTSPSASSSLAGSALALDLREVDLAAGQRAQVVVLVALDLLQPELVDRVVEQQHLHALGQRLLELRAGAQGGVALAADVEDRLLALLHPRHIVGEAGPAGTVRAAEAGELQELRPVVGILVEALLEHGAELAPPLLVALGLSRFAPRLRRRPAWPWPPARPAAAAPAPSSSWRSRHRAAASRG